MDRLSSLDSIDQSILRILLAHDQLTPLELWYEFGEDDAAKETVTEEEMVIRLESLTARGLVEKVTEGGADRDSGYVAYRLKTGPDKGMRT